jgi:hypothetical protein
MVVDLVRRDLTALYRRLSESGRGSCSRWRRRLTRMAPLTNPLDYGVPSSGNFTCGDERGSAGFAPGGERAGLWSRDAPRSRDDRRIDLPSTLGFGGYAVANAYPMRSLASRSGSS